MSVAQESKGISFFPPKKDSLLFIAKSSLYIDNQQ